MQGPTPGILGDYQTPSHTTRQKNSVCSRIFQRWECYIFMVIRNDGYVRVRHVLGHRTDIRSDARNSVRCQAGTSIYSYHPSLKTFLLFLYLSTRKFGPRDLEGRHPKYHRSRMSVFLLEGWVGLAPSLWPNKLARGITIHHSTEFPLPFAHRLSGSIRMSNIYTADLLIRDHE